MAKIDKAAFKKGCQEGNGSYVENASDNTFGCNTSGGVFIRCSEGEDTKCWLAAPLTPKVSIVINLEGEMADNYTLPLTKGTSLVINLEAERAVMKKAIIPDNH